MELISDRLALFDTTSLYYCNAAILDRYRCSVPGFASSGGLHLIRLDNASSCPTFSPLAQLLSAKSSPEFLHQRILLK